MAKPGIRKVRWLAHSSTIFLILISLMESPDRSTASLASTPLTTIQLQPVVTTGLSSPLYVTNAHDGSNRLLIVEQPGRITMLQPGQNSPTVFLDITSKVLFGGEQGLLGLAFHPRFGINGRLFVDYTRQPDGATVIAEYHVSQSNPNIADTEETVILTIAQPFANHNGGMIEFGADGFLYVAMGDGGSGNDPGNRAQNIDELLGKILRIDIDHPNGSVPYSSPSDNPFFGPTPGRDEIFAYGLRNPWRFSFDRNTGQLYVADVGQNAFEEIDIVTRGGNFGWRVFEGNHCTNIDPPLCSGSGFVFPIAEYGHAVGCSIVGGYVYRGPIGTLPSGAYVYGDLCTGEIFVLQNGSQSVLLDTALTISSFGEDEAGEIYVVGLGGTVHRIVNPDSPCSFFVSPSSRVFNARGGPASTVVTAPENCSWTAISNASFITITAGSAGTGTGAVNYSVAANPGGSRTGTITIAGETFIVSQTAKGNLYDFDGDSRTDIAVWRPLDGFWNIINSSTGGGRFQGWGLSTDELVPGDYDGDGNTDLAIWRPSDGNWWIINSSDSSLRLQNWGLNGDVPVPADYDGDGKIDLAVWRPSDGFWYIINSSTGGGRFQGWGVSTDKLVPGDYDGDGKTDLAIWRPSDGNWWIINSSNGSVKVQNWGLNGDVPVPGDYDGDGRTDLAVWRPSDGIWYIINSSTGGGRFQGWGLSTDKLVPGDYDGDGKTDVAIWRPSDGNWWIINSSTGTVKIQNWGLSSDVPLPSVFIR
ncbi:MAG: PQQ-dependent sugar dehydrogenase [Acidobacteriota bacterium]